VTIVGRSLHGFALLAWLGGQYLLIHWLKRFWRWPARQWRRQLDPHGARLLAAYVRRHGGLLIKIGQYVATRSDFFPLPYVEACAPLRDQAPARPFTAMRPVLAEAYEGRIETHLARVEELPIAAASFGQVHRAWLGDGRLVAVKIQYPDLGPKVAADLMLVRATIALFQFLLPGWPLHHIEQEIRRTSREEQDYLHEASAADRLRGGLARCGLTVPAVLWEHTRERVLVMEFAHGTTLAQLNMASLDAGERQRWCDALIRGFLFMLLDEGFFHADPHGGNLIYDTSLSPPRLWLIDFGMTASITPRDREQYRRFLDSLRRNDTDGMVDVLAEIGWVLPNADRTRLKALAREVYTSLAHMDPRTFKGSRRSSELGSKVGEFMRRMEGIIFPRHTVLLSRASGILEGVCTELVPGRGMLALLRPHLRSLRSLRARLRELLMEARQAWRNLTNLPETIATATPRPADTATRPLLAAILLLAAALAQDLDPTFRLIIAGTAGAALLLSLRRRS
jgi:ubiquinone biosynthesis protein